MSPLPSTPSMRRAGVCLLLSAAARLPSQAVGPQPAEQRKAVVTIYSAVGKHGYIGSGALISPLGDILTCYHVVEGAQSIIVVTEGAAGGLSNVSVEQISPDRDLAVLRLTSQTRPLPFLPLARQKPVHLLDRTLRAYGYLMGLQRQVIEAKATQDEEAPAADLREPGYGIFNPSTELTIIPLAMTIFHGLSGGPVVAGDGVIGVVSGSISQGGSLAWAIPVSNLGWPGMRAIGTRPAQVPWTPLTLMAAPWKNMRAEVTSADAAMEAVQRFVEAMDQTRLAVRAFQQSVSAYNANTAAIIAALGEIPADRQSRRSSEIARDPELQQLNGRIAALFQEGAELQNRFNQSGERMTDAAAQTERDLQALAGEFAGAVRAVPSIERNQPLLRAVDAEITETRQRIAAHPFPQIKTPEVVVRDADSVSVAQLRSYLIQTRANLEEALTPAFTGRVDAFFAARESLASPVEHLLVMSAR